MNQYIREMVLSTMMQKQAEERSMATRRPMQMPTGSVPYQPR